MKILFVYTNVGTFNPPNYQHGIGALSAFARAAGHDTALISLDHEVDRQGFLRQVARHSPDLVGLHANSPQWSVVKQLGRWVKAADRTLPVVCGGTHPTTRPEDVLTSGAVDYVVRGEGEEALVELAAALERRQPADGIANLGMLRGDKVLLNPVRDLLPDLDRLPFPDRGIFDFQGILDANGGEAPFMAGRGCPFACSYCCNNFLQRIYAGRGRYTRFRSPGLVVEELERMRSEYRFASVYFQDDTFTLDTKWLGRFGALYRERVGLPYRAQARVDLVDEEMVDLLASSGCRHLNFGIEAGDERIRREVMRRDISDAQIERAFRLARSRGIKLWSYNIIGSPGEGEEEIRRTIEMNRALEPDHVQVSIFNPYPGTALYEQCVAEHSVAPDIADDGLPTSFFVELPRVARRSVADERLKALYEEFVQLALRLEARRDPRGAYDFVDRLAAAEVESPSPDHVSLQMVHLGEEERLCLFEHPPARVTYRVPVAGPSRLVFGVALNPRVWEGACDGVRFRLEVDGEVPFSAELDPVRRPEHRRWLDFEVELPAGPTGDRTVAFVTEPVGRPDFGWALWARPHLVSRGVT